MTCLKEVSVKIFFTNLNNEIAVNVKNIILTPAFKPITVKIISL